MKSNNLPTCGQCKHFTPKINPKTGAVLYKRNGECSYSVVWPFRIPMCYEMMDPDGTARFPRKSFVWHDFDAANCRCFTPKKEKQAQSEPWMPTDQDIIDAMYDGVNPDGAFEHNPEPVRELLWNAIIKDRETRK